MANRENSRGIHHHQKKLPQVYGSSDRLYCSNIDSVGRTILSIKTTMETEASNGRACNISRHI